MRLAFSERELDVMTVLWDAGAATVAEVRDGLAARDIRVSHNTVLSILRILEDKGRVAREPFGRGHRYRAIVAREAAGTSALARLRDTIFGGSAARLLTHLAADPQVTADELRRLRALVDDRLGAGGDAQGGAPDEAHGATAAAADAPTDRSSGRAR